MIKAIASFFSVNYLLNIDNIVKSNIIDQDLHKYIVDLHTNGLAYRKISSQLNVPMNSVGTIVCHWKMHHSIHPKISSGHPRKVMKCTRLFARKVGNEHQVRLKILQGKLEVE